MSENQLVGFVKVCEADPVEGTYKVGVVVSDDHRRKRHAVNALNLLFDHMQKLRYPNVRADILENNTASIGLFGKLGFTETGRNGEYINFTR